MSRNPKFPTWKRLVLSCGCRIAVGSNVDPASVTKCGDCREKVTAVLEPAPAVEPWQMPKVAFTEQALATDQPYQNALKNTPHNAPIAREHAMKRAERAHAKAVLDALKDGRDVPDAVLADYPGWHRLKQEPQPEQPTPAPLVESPSPVIAPEVGRQATFGF